jgi:phage tail-like protein
VSTYRLDSGDFQTQWGRLFIDACIPAGTSVRFECLVLDDPPEDEPTLPRTLPTKLVTQVIRRPDLSPPMPPLSLVPASDLRLTGAFHRRESGCEVPWSDAPSDAFVTYEAPIHALAGRYLWVFLELSGNTRLSPRVRSLRAEHPSHDLLRRLPATFSRSTASADFLRRFLAMFDGLFSELEGRSAFRQSLVLPRATPEDLLPWLSRFVGLTLDERWSSDVRRTFIEEAIDLFRFRGTLHALERMLHIALGIKPTLLEHFRVRGMGGAIVGAEGAAMSSAVLGGGMRVGGQIGFGEAEVPVFGTLDDAFELHAHRFSVIVPRALTLDELECARFILDEHRPAHTLYDICTTDAGMRAGIGAHVGLSAVVGRTGGFETVQLGGAALGRGAIIGRPGHGIALGNTRLGAENRIK